jgi:Zn-dependent M16 (insulinase) family peptidase
MSDLHGFELVREQDIPEINSHAKIYRHIKTGAELLSIQNDDENKVFGISFTTPPEDSTGLPHILEHSVLCGSRKYPTKEPFIELAKSSLNTFLNAMTFSDKTMYPVASQVDQDLYNLVDVYLDAVFHPNITPETLMQEGWHYELDAEDQQMVFKGVVFNEMKGAYSSPEGLLGRHTESAALPDTVYGNDSGGDPEAIPDLTYEQFKKFHETYYHPSNAKIFFYGNDNPEKRLEILDSYLSEFDRQDVDASIALQTPFDEPIRTVIGYDAGESEDSEDGKKGMMTVTWLMDETLDVANVMALEILDHILLGTPASPLRKALLESGLGENTIGGGLDNQIRQMLFSTGMKGIAPDEADKVETLIVETLQDLATNGIDPETIEASLNTVEFQLREANTGRYPRGLFYFINACSTWNFGGDPIAPLAFEAPLNSIKEKAADGNKFFEGLIKQYFVDNPHRSTVLLKPDPNIREQKEARERDRLAQARESMSEDDIKHVIETTHTLKEMQETPDSPEALATIPTLTLDDLDRDIKTTPTTISDLHGSTLYYHDIGTSGIVYLDLGMNLFGLPQDLLPYVGPFSRALTEMGTETEDYVKLIQRIGRQTGGVGATSFTSAKRTTDDSTAWLFVRAKAAPDQTGDMLAILRDILTTTKFDNKERFKQIITKSKASLETRLVPGGTGFVATRLNARFNLAGWISEQMGGVSYLFFLRDLLEQIESDWTGVVAKLEAVRDHLLNRDMMVVNVTLDNDNWQTFQPQLADFIADLPAKGDTSQIWTPDYGSGNEGLAIPAQVNYVGLGTNIFKLGYERHGSAAVILNYLRSTYLWDTIRVQGGAYGGFAVYNGNSGVFNYLSYRDPNLTGTLGNYHRTAEFLKNLDLSQSELERSIIGTIGDMDSYQLPDAKGFSAMIRHLTNTTDEERRKSRNEVFSTTVEDFKAFADVLAKVNDNGTVIVMGSREALENANTSLDSPMQIVKVL